MVWVGIMERKLNFAKCEGDRMKNLMVIMALLLGISLVTGCGTKTQETTVQGQPGIPGNDGQNGSDGYSIVAKTVSNPAVCGTSGGTSVLLALDLDRNLEFGDDDQVQTQYVTCNGRDGQNGVNGTNGLNGSSCTVNKVGASATITCGSSSAIVTDGAKGDKGNTGDTGATGPAGTNASGIYITEVINPCGEEFNNDEVFLRLSTGRILALYDGGANQDRLALIAPGNYITTDAVQNKSCAFTVTNDYKITNEVRQ